MKKRSSLLFVMVLMLGFVSCKHDEIRVESSSHDLVFDDIARSWDEGMPLGNAVVGALVWEKNTSLRLSLDRVDLWDLRSMENREGDKFSFKWVYDQVMKKDYKPVQEAFDVPYDNNPGPSKIPGAALEFDISGMGELESNHLYLNNALCQVSWKNGATLQTFVHATQPVGWFVVEGADESFVPELIPPIYSSGNNGGDDGPVSGLSLSRLGYEQGEITREDNKIVYHQVGWGDFYYDVAVKWKRDGSRLSGAWSITSSMVNQKASILVDDAMSKGPETQYAEHMDWWEKFWGKSTISIPDTLLEKQYYNEMYKFGSAVRSDSYPVSLQAVWTANNAKLPPWKGDYHHDLNTQLSYWPAYTGNYLNEGMGYLNTLWNQRDVHKQYTKEFYGTSGLNVPGVCTLTGEPMGGWIQYSFSPTVSAWLSQHFYLHWKYSNDEQFLKERAYPYIKNVATHLEEISILKDGIRTLPLSSSPELYDNSLKAWFQDITNYDLGLISFAFKSAAEMADALNLPAEARHWQKLRSELPYYNLDELGGLSFAKGHPYSASHRHFSHLMAIHPLGIIDWSHGEKEQKIIQATIDKLDEVGPDYWTGYSYSWLGNLKARAFDGEGAAVALRDFASCFCLRNTFHVNGDQSRSGKSKFLYRPFTLEGNFAFASGIQEMLIQSHTGIIHLFPAIPKKWNDLEFNKLRAQGAFVISAKRKNGQTTSVKVLSEKGGEFKLQNPFDRNNFSVHNADFSFHSGFITINMDPGQEIELTKN